MVFENAAEYPAPDTRTFSVGPDTTVTVPYRIRNQTPEDLQEQITNSFDEIESRRYKPRSVPKELRGTNPLLNHDYLASSLLVPRQYRLGELTEETEKRTTERAGEALAQKQPLRILIGPLESFKAFNHFAQTTGRDYTDYLFLRQAGDILGTLKDYPYGVEATILLDDIGSEFVWNGSGFSIAPDANAEYKQTIQELMPLTLPPPEEGVNCTLLTTSAMADSGYRTYLDSTHQELKAIWEKLRPMYDGFSYFGKEKVTWDEYFLSMKQPPPYGRDFYYKAIEPLMAKIYELYPQIKEAGIGELTPYSIFMLSHYVFLLASETPDIADEESIPIDFCSQRWSQPPKVLDAAWRILAREMVYNQIHITDREERFWGNKATSVVKPGDLSFFPRKFLSRFGNCLTLSGLKYSHLPAYIRDYLEYFIPKTFPAEDRGINFPSGVYTYQHMLKNDLHTTVRVKGLDFPMPLVAGNVL